ncbi:MAG: hypothetical protein NVSMB43_00780 [Pseudarthrobacter sp.]
MTAELERLSLLAAAIGAAEQDLAAADRILRQTAAALPRCGEATLAEVSEASGLDRGELYALRELAGLPHQHRNQPGNRLCTRGYRHWEDRRLPGSRRAGKR